MKKTFVVLSMHIVFCIAILSGCDGASTQFGINSGDVKSVSGEVTINKAAVSCDLLSSINVEVDKFTKVVAGWETITEKEGNNATSLMETMNINAAKLMITKLQKYSDDIALITYETTKFCTGMGASFSIYLSSLNASKRKQCQMIRNASETQSTLIGIELTDTDCAEIIDHPITSALNINNEIQKKWSESETGIFCERISSLIEGYAEQCR